MTFRASDDGLTLKTSALETIYILSPAVKTKSSFYIPCTPTNVAPKFFFKSFVLFISKSQPLSMFCYS